MEKNFDTIVACASGYGGAIAIIRISGKEALKIAQQCLYAQEKKDNKKQNTKEPLKIAENPRKQLLGILDTGKVKDKVMAVYFKAPNSYTGEDVVEIYIHGSRWLIDDVIRKVISLGARIATAGEFTKRAVINEKTDLSAAEAVISIINAQSKKEIDAAFKIYSGELKQQINQIASMIKSLLSRINASLDYPEEGIIEEEKKEIKEKIGQVIPCLIKLKESYKRGKKIKAGIQVIITGRTNVGKSQLFNSLIQAEEAIVSDIPGTTRDIKKEFYEYKGYRFNVVDTAGIREAIDELEKKGIEKTQQCLLEADIILEVTEAQCTACSAPYSHKKDSKQEVIYVKNKIDLTPCFKLNQIKGQNEIAISALKGINIEKLKEAIFIKAGLSNTSILEQAEDRYEEDKKDGEELILTEFRHYECVNAALSALKSALKNTASEVDLIAAELFFAYESLGQITGETGRDGVIDEIFAKFCVGK